MYPAQIDHYFKPATVDEARRLAREADGEVFYMAGGMSLMQALKSRMLAPNCLIDLNGLEELKGVRFEGDAVWIGAMTRYRSVAESSDQLAPFHALSDAATHVGDRQVRNRGTVGGSLAWNYVSACTPVAALALNVQVEVLRASGESEALPIDEFLLGPMMTALEEGDLLVSVSLTKSGARAGSAYRKWGVVHDALPVVGVGVYLELGADGRTSDGRFAVGGLAAGPQRSGAAEQRIRDGLDPDDEAALRGAAVAAAEELETDDDPWISAEYKTHLIERLGTELLERAAQRAKDYGNA